ncbi:hypothetical protein RIF29_00226 [Crotalaria pallida]|uniref:Uncharacterized protein n=1 Tax=Crotalaria pallida TaxID=3830 RepID=A0AAN9P6H7_CROPI
MNTFPIAWRFSSYRRSPSLEIRSPQLSHPVLLPHLVPEKSSSTISFQKSPSPPSRSRTFSINLRFNPSSTPIIVELSVYQIGGSNENVEFNL